MSWKGRFLVTGIILLLSCILGLLGALLGKFLPLYLALLSVVCLGIIFLPWYRESDSQEDLLQLIDSTTHLFGEVGRRQSELSLLREKIEAGGVLDDKTILQYRQEYQNIRTLEPQEMLLLREILFAEYRRNQAILPIILLLSAVGGVLLAIPFSKMM